jgi:hypothetical protein
MRKTILITILIFLLLAVFAGFWFGLRFIAGEYKPAEPIVCTMEAKLCPDGSYVGRTGPNCEFAPCPKENLIDIFSLRAYEGVSSPLLIKGEARGFWFFEAVFPVKLLDGNGNLISQGLAQAKGEWMTEDFVPFEATLEFQMPKTEKGTLVLEKDNPSGLPQNSDELRIPVYFNQ